MFSIGNIVIAVLVAAIILLVILRLIGGKKRREKREKEIADAVAAELVRLGANPTPPPTPAPAPPSPASSTGSGNTAGTTTTIVWWERRSTWTLIIGVSFLAVIGWIILAGHTSYLTMQAKENLQAIILFMALVAFIALALRLKWWKPLAGLALVVFIILLLFRFSTLEEWKNRLNEISAFNTIPSPTAEVDEGIINFHSISLDDTPIRVYRHSNQCIYRSPYSKTRVLSEGMDAHGHYAEFDLKPGILGPLEVNFWLREKVGGKCPPS